MLGIGEFEISGAAHLLPEVSLSRRFFRRWNGAIREPWDLLMLMTSATRMENKVHHVLC